MKEIESKDDAYSFINLQLNRQLQWTVAALGLFICYIEILLSNSKNRYIFYSIMSLFLNIGFIFFIKRALWTYPLIAYVEDRFQIPRYPSPLIENFILSDIKEMSLREQNVTFLFVVITLIWHIMLLHKLYGPFYKYLKGFIQKLKNFKL